MKSVLSFGRKGIIIPLYLLMALTFSGCMRSPEAKSAAYMEAGKKLLQKKDVARAILQFRSAAQASPRNPETYYQLGIADLAAGDIRNGVAALRRALELNPKHAAAQLRMAELMSQSLDSGQLKDAQQQLKNILEDSPDNPDALHALALTELKLGEAGDAVQHLERAMVAAPEQVIIAATLAEAKLRQNDIKGAEEVLTRASKSNPNSADVPVLLARFYAYQNRMPDAEAEYQQALKMDANHAAALLGLAALENRVGRKHEAEQIYKRMSLLSNNAVNATYGSFLFEAGRRDEAVREFERLARQDPSDRVARTRLVAAYQSVNRTQDAEKILRQALNKNSKDLDALLQRGEMFELAGQYGKAEEDLNEVLRLEPNSAEVYYVRAKLHQLRGAALTYREDLSRALQLNPYLLAGRLELSQALILGNNAKAALDVLNEAPESQRDSVPVLAQRNWALWAMGDMPGMRKGIDQGLSRQKTPDLLVQDGLWKLRAGDFAGAQVAVEAALNIDPSDLQALKALALTYSSQKQNAVALQKVKEYAAREPKSAPVQYFLGTMLLAGGDLQQARRAFEAARAADPKFVEASLLLVQTDVVDGKYDDAQHGLETVLSSDRANTIARLWLANLEVMKGNQKAALEHYREVVAADPGNAQALNNLAYLLAENANQTSEALKYAQKAKELAPENQGYSDTLGWIFYRQGLYPLAVQELERATAKNGEPTWKYHLAMAYAKSGDVNRGRAILEAALKQNPNLPEAKLAQEMLGAPAKQPISTR